MTDALLILANADDLAMVEQRTDVRQRYGPRVLVVASEAAAHFEGVAGVSVFPPGSGNAVPPPDASETERIGVDAWNTRVESGDKVRPGDTLSWDAPGFDAP